MLVLSSHRKFCFDYSYEAYDAMVTFRMFKQWFWDRTVYTVVEILDQKNYCEQNKISAYFFTIYLH